MALTPGQLTTIYTIAGLYGNEQGWVDEAAVNELAIYIGAVTGDDFNVAYNNRLAVECLKVAVARGVTGERTESLRRRIQELLSRPAAAIISPTGDAALNAEIAARISGDNVEALARSDADTALGVRIDGVAAGADDATARAAAATAQALAEANETKINTNAGNITAVRDAGVREAQNRTTADTGLGTRITNEATTRAQSAVKPAGTTGQVYSKASNADFDGAWADPSGGGGGDDAVARAAAAAAQASANAADAKAVVADGKAVAAQTAAGVADAKAVVADGKAVANTANITTNAQGVTTEAQARSDADVALTARIDALPTGGGGGAGISETIYDHAAEQINSAGNTRSLLATITFEAVENEVVELVISSELHRLVAATNYGSTFAVSLATPSTSGMAAVNNAAGEFVGAAGIPTENPPLSRRLAGSNTLVYELDELILSYLSKTTGTKTIYLVWVGNTVIRNTQVRLIRGGLLATRVLFNGAVPLTSNGNYIQLAATVLVPTTGTLQFLTNWTTRNRAGYFEVPAENFILRNRDGNNQGATPTSNNGWAVSVGATNYVTFSSRLDLGIRRFYVAASIGEARHLIIKHVPVGGGGGGSGGGTVDQTAREQIAAVRTEIGAIPAPIATVGGWITNLGQAVQLDADEEGTLNTKINGVNNRLVDEVTAREADQATFTQATGQNALHIANEVTARTAADVALGLRIDGITTPDYRPGVAPYKFEGSTRAAAVAAREEYFLGEVALSQAYAQIFSAGAASRIRVTLDPSVPTQVGAAGNSWNLVLGTDHQNDSVTIVPDTPGETFTLRLPAAGISLDTLAGDLDSNSRLNAEVVGNGAALVDYTATWGANPVVGSTTPFGNGGDQSTTERTAWRAVYEANPDLVIVLDYLDLEEYQHWGAADWESVLTLVDPPTPIWSAGSSQNFFTGSSRTAAAAARDEYSLRNTGVVQATRRLPLGTSPTAGVLVTLTADAAIGAVGNTWTLIANGAAFAGSNSALAYDIVNQVVGVNYNAANLTAEALAHLFNVTPGFSAELVGGISPTATGFIAAQLAGAFAGGVNAAFNPRTVWIADYDNDRDQYITLNYGQTVERQVRRNSQWATIDTIQLPVATPAGVRLLTHPNAVPGENYQWWQNVTNSTVGQSFIERTGGTIQVPEVGSEYLTIPATNSIVYFRVSDGTNTVIATLAHLVLPDGSRVASAVTVMLGTQPILLTILATGRVVGTRPTAGTTNVGLDAWVQ